MDLDLNQLLDLGGRVGAGKTSSSSVSLNQAIREAQEADEMDTKSSTKGATSRAEKVARAKAGTAQRESERAANEKQYGTGETSKVNAVRGQGPFNKGFEQLAAGDPLRATQELDFVEQTLGLKSSNPKTPPAKEDAPIRKGVHTGAAGGDVPYFTNLPGAAGSSGGPMEGVRDLKEYNASPRTAGLGGGANEDPRMRGVAERIRSARDEVQYGAKSGDVIAKEVSGKFDSAVKDIKELGNEAASQKWLGQVASGELSDAAYKRLHAEAATVAADQDELEYAKMREQVTTVARNEGVTNALQFLKENTLGGTGGNPKHMKRVETELRMRARPAASTEMQMTPDLYLPASRADAMQVLGRAPGTAVDAKAPPTLLNPHDGPTAANVAHQAAEDAGMTLEELVQGQAGTKAKTASDYTGPATDAGPAPGSFGTRENPRSDAGKAVRAMQKRQRKSDRAPYDPEAESDIGSLLKRVM